MSSRPVRRSLRYAGSALSILVALAVLAPAARAVQPVSGLVFNDYNANGTKDGGGGGTGVARDDGVAGVTVTAFGPGGGQVASTTTGAGGGYTLQIPDGVPRVRIEFTGFPPGYLSGPHGTDSGTTVQFVDLTDANPDTSVNLGIAVPEDYCANNPLLVTTCFRFGPVAPTNIAGNLTAASVIAFPYAPTAIDPGPANTLATFGQTGAVYGEGFDPRTGDLYVSAFFKTHSGFGPADPTGGAVYRIPFTGGAGTGYGPPTLWARIPGTTNAHTASTVITPDWVADNMPASFDAVGKTSLGDIDVAPDGTALFAVNLDTRTLVRVPLATGTPAAGVPIPAPAGCADPDWRPFGLGIHRGSVYVGGVCTNQSTQNRTTPSFAAHVLRFDIAAGTFAAAPVLDVALNPTAYPRKCGDNAGNSRADDGGNPGANCPSTRGEWNAWVNAAQAPARFGSGNVSYPQPMLTDVTFDGDAMLVGLRDRTGDQLGNQAYGPFYPSTNLTNAIPAGDLLRACPGGPGWVIESNAGCGGVTTGGAGSGEGPGGGEYYRSDDSQYHDQGGLGAIAQVPGFDDVVTSLFDPLYNPYPPPSGDDGLWDGGVIWESNATGQRTRSGFRIYNGSAGNQNVFGKANGIGDLEARCRMAPLEIGNRVWLDTNRDGVQGAETDEPPIPGVVVELWQNGSKVTQTTTDARGEYYFPNVNPNADYQVRIDTTQPVLAPYLPTGANQGGKDTVDSDGVPSGTYVNAAVRTRGPGDNDHTYDFGFYEHTDVQIAKVASLSVARVGEQFTYTVTIRNNGPAIARDVVVSDTLPDIVRYISLTTTKGTCTGEREITCRFGDLAPNEEAVVTLRVEAVATGSTRNVAIVDTATPETKPPNNIAVTPPAPRLILKKTADRRIVRGGRTVSYRIQVRNIGTAAAKNRTVCDRLGAYMRFVSTPGARRSGGRACWRVSRLDIKQQRVLRVVARADRINRAARSTNTATVGDVRSRASVRILPVVQPVTG